MGGFRRAVLKWPLRYWPIRAAWPMGPTGRPPIPTSIATTRAPRRDPPAQTPPARGAGDFAPPAPALPRKGGGRFRQGQAQAMSCAVSRVGEKRPLRAGQGPAPAKIVAAPAGLLLFHISLTV